MNKKFPLVLALVMASFTAAAYAEETDHAGHHPAAPGGSESMTAKDKAGRMQSEGYMRKMHEQMQKIKDSTDPMERERLLEEHMQTMRETMQDMHERHTGADEAERTSLGTRMQQMEQHMEHMQAMFEQMLENEQQVRESEKIRKHKHEITK